MSTIENAIYVVLEFVNFALAVWLFTIGILYFFRIKNNTRYIKLAYSFNALIVMMIYFVHWHTGYSSPAVTRAGLTLILLSLVFGTSVSYYKAKRDKEAT